MNKLNPLGRYCIYLRKSRADTEAELRGEGETLARHEQRLLEVAKRLNLHIGAIYREVVSGESIQNRPVMQQLLEEVNHGMWDGVLVVEVERLARGDTSDQGTIAKSFKYSDTLIITPAKIYDPNDEFDEEYFEFGLFMSRREYKTINRRLQNGRYTSIKEGKYVGNKAPYGYDRVKIPHDKGFTLQINEFEQPWAKKIFEWFNGIECEKIGTSMIANKLNELGIPSRTGAGWTPATIRGMLRNPVYAGWIRWGRRKIERTLDSSGRVSLTRPINNDYMLTKGMHPAIISQDLFDATTARIKSNSVPQYNVGKLTSPLAGLVICGECGRHMIKRPYVKKDKPDSLICAFKDCKTVSSQLSLVEQQLLISMHDWVSAYKIDSSACFSSAKDIELLESTLLSKKEEFESLQLQHVKQYDFLEKGIYSEDVFLQRSGAIQDKINSIVENISDLQSRIDAENARIASQNDFLPKCEYLLDNYDKLNVRAKNELWKELLEKVEYTKTEKNKRGEGDKVTFTLQIYPKIPYKPK